MSRSVRLFRKLLKLFPAEFRGDFGEEMTDVFRDQHRDAEHGGSMALVALWWDTLRGIVTTAPREHADLLRQDVGYGMRMLARAPAFTTAAVLTLALGIGANTAIFTLVNAVLLRELPYRDADRLLWVHGSFSGGDMARVSPPDFQDYRARTHSFSALAAMFPFPYTITGGADPQRVDGALVSVDFFDALGAAAVVGRTFDAADAADVDRATTVVISYGLWQRFFGGRPDITAQSLVVNGRASAIIGVMPASFAMPRDAELWVPCTMRGPDMNLRAAHFLIPIARLRDGITRQQAQQDTDRIAAALAREYPQTNTTWKLRLVPLREELAGTARPTLLMLTAAVAVVLLIACVNVANLLLARAAVRSRELAVRAALGAGRARLARQLLTESLLLAGAGGAAGIALARWSLAALASLAPADLADVTDVSIDLRVLVFTLALSVVCGVVFGMLPAVRAGRTDLRRALQPADHGGATHRSAVGRTLVVAELALATALMMAAGLLVRTMSRLDRVDPGFDPRGLTAFQASLPTALDEPAVRRFFGAFIDRIETLPGVQHAALASEVPLIGQHSDTFFRVAGRTRVDPNDRPTANVRRVTSDYFAALGVPIVRGRPFTRDEAHSDAGVVAINQAMARMFFTGDPLGQQLLIERFPGERAYQIVAIVGDIHHDALDAPAAPEMYLPTLTFWTPNVVIRSPLPSSAIAAVVRPELKRLDPTVPMSTVTPYEERLRDSIASHRFRTLLLIVFSAIALALAAVGVYGLAAYSVSQRTREIGLRMALGAPPSSMLRAELMAAVRLAAIGITAGLVVGLGLARTLTGLLFNVTASDPATLTATVALLSSMTLAASYGAARRATRIDPLIALRAE